MAETIYGDGAIRREGRYVQSEITALAAAHIAADLLCVMRNRKLRKRRT